jgi:hypothetical protein
VKVFLFILALACSVQAQEWKLIKEMSNDRIEVYATEIARDGDKLKLLIRADFPKGSPRIEGAKYPDGVSYNEIRSIIARAEFNCQTGIAKPSKGSAEIITIYGERYKTKEKALTLPANHPFAEYFCERGEKATKAPTLRNP